MQDNTINRSGSGGTDMLRDRINRLEQRLKTLETRFERENDRLLDEELKARGLK